MVAMNLPGYALVIVTPALLSGRVRECGEGIRDDLDCHSSASKVPESFVRLYASLTDAL